MQTVQYEVTGLTCNGCVARVRKTLSEFADDVEVTLNPPMVTINNQNANFSQLNKALATVGNYALVPTETVSSERNKSQTSTTQEKSWFETYKPLLLIFAYILIVTLAIETVYGSFVLSRWMPNFMAGFFIVFSFFKLLDLEGFANSYAMYDLLAKKVNSYGLVYPFIELTLGLGYLTKWQPVLINWATLIVMGFSSIGVILAVMNKQKIKCACLGTGFNLPMSTVTIIEDLLMVGMALVMILKPTMI